MDKNTSELVAKALKLDVVRLKEIVEELDNWQDDLLSGAAMVDEWESYKEYNRFLGDLSKLTPEQIAVEEIEKCRESLSNLINALRS